MTREAPPAQVALQPGADQAADALGKTVSDSLPDSPGDLRYPDAVPVPAEQTAPVVIEAETQSNVGSIYTLDGRAAVTRGDRMLQADHIVYDSDTGEAILTGHLLVTGGPNDESIRASHGTINVKTHTGRFYDVTGSVGIKAKPEAGENQMYTNSNPLLFSGRMVVKTGPREYQIYDGTLTSCRLAQPDWFLSSALFRVDAEKASASKSVFHLMNLPVLWLPYVTHPVDPDQRQSGLLIPEVGVNSASKGDTIGEQFYWAINRSTDLTVGSIFYSARGWEQSASFHYHGVGQDFAKARYSGLQDRGYTPSGGSYINQSGTDVTFSGRRDLLVGNNEDSPTSIALAANSQTRAVADVEYLSSFPYREAFSSNFNQAVSSDVVSTVYLAHEWNGMAVAAEGDRYQGEKRVATTLLPEQQLHIFHAPALEFSVIDHELGASGLEWNLDSSVAMLKRIQPSFVTGGMVERVDVRPELARPFTAGGWRVRPSVATRETFYSRSHTSPGSSSAPGAAPSTPESLATLNREDVEVQFDLRPPVIERTFEQGFVQRLLRHDVKHTIEPELTYRYASGIDNFQQVLRFDAVDVASNTNELEYGVTQRLFLRRSEANPCRAAGTGADANEILSAAGGAATGEAEVATGRPDNAQPVCGNREWISWRVAQKYFFDSRFGGAVVEGKRNILSSTLDFSGIAFLTEPRDISPLVSRLRVRTSEKTDLEWDFDYDTGAKKFTANNIYADVHHRDFFAGVSFARLNAPGRAYVEGVASSVAEFEQMRTTLGFGKPTKAGWSAAIGSGIDLDLGTPQYGSVQASYNWDCCGVSVEYQKYELGSTRNDGGVKFSFTLANIGSAGNLRRSNQLF